jgi:hypothetical protein
LEKNSADQLAALRTDYEGRINKTAAETAEMVRNMQSQEAEWNDILGGQVPGGSSASLPVVPGTVVLENPIEDDDDWPEQPASRSSALRQVPLSPDVGGDVENPVADPDIEEVLKLTWTSKPITVRRTMSTSSPKVRQLKPGTTVTVYERGESEGSERVRIGDDEWTTAVTAKGKVLLFDPEENLSHCEICDNVFWILMVIGHFVAYVFACGMCMCSTSTC